MKFAIAGLIAGILLGIAGTAGAYARYWKQTGATYVCQGIPTGAACTLKGSPYRVGIIKGTGGDPNFVSIARAGKLVFTCSMYDDPYDCLDFRN